MEVHYILLNLAPLAPMALLAGGAFWWLRSSLWAWVGVGLVALCVPGIVLTWYLRSLGFEAFGGACTPDKARSFMEGMQFVFLAQILIGIVGATILGGLAFKRSTVRGGILGLALMATSVMTGGLIYFAAGMTAVDGYAC